MIALWKTDRLPDSSFGQAGPAAPIVTLPPSSLPPTSLPAVLTSTQHHQITMSLKKLFSNKIVLALEF